MYSLSFLIVELETARTTLLDAFDVSTGTPTNKSDAKGPAESEEHRRQPFQPIDAPQMRCPSVARRCSP